MKTFIFKVERQDLEFTVHSDDILADFMKEPGILIEFIKKALTELSNDENEITKVLLKELVDSIRKM